MQVALELVYAEHSCSAGFHLEFEKLGTATGFLDLDRVATEKVDGRVPA